MRPTINDVPEWYRGYLNRVEGDNGIEALKASFNETLAILKQIPEAKADFQYAENKWTIKQLLQHLVDSEVVFGYRGLWIARNAPEELFGFEENDWAKIADVSDKSLENLIDAYSATRSWTISLFGSLTNEDLMRQGVASGHTIKAFILPFLIAGHNLHHLDVLKERYL